MPLSRMKNRVRALFILIAVSALTTSCSTIYKSDVPELELEEPTYFWDEYRHYRGAIHVHTQYSKDTDAPLDELREALDRHKMDYAIITDHNTLEGQELLQGFHGRTLWLFGTEISTSAGKYLALDTKIKIPSDRDYTAISEEVNASGGMGFIAHSFGKKEPWHDWNVREFTGMEIYDAADDVYDEMPVWLGAIWLLTPEKFFGQAIFDRPTKALKKWDELTQERRVVGIGGNDAHGNVRVRGRSLASYEFMISRVSTYILAKKLTEKHIYEALREGRAFVAFEQWGDARPFTFHAINGKRHAVMGEEIDLTDTTELRIYISKKSKIRVLKNGQPFLDKEAQELQIPVKEPGIYRVEVFNGRKLWILSNPIYVRT